jgi:hypothetical protein
MQTGMIPFKPPALWFVVLTIILEVFAWTIRPALTWCTRGRVSSAGAFVHARQQAVLEGHEFPYPQALSSATLSFPKPTYAGLLARRRLPLEELEWED